MPPITGTMPIYEGLLQLATPDEHDTIVGSGVRQRPLTPLYESEEEAARAGAGYRTIRSILSRAVNDPALRFTGIDPRVTPPRRETIEAEVLLTGRLRWSKRPGVESRLELSWMTPGIVIVNLQVEPREEPAASTRTVMSLPKGLSSGERIDDDARLRRMQTIINEGHLPKTAARRVAVEMPSRGASDDSLTTRLVRKFKKLSQT